MVSGTEHPLVNEPVLERLLNHMEKRSLEDSAWMNQRFEEIMTEHRRALDEAAAESARRFEETTAASSQRFDDMKMDMDRRFEENSRRFDEVIAESRRNFAEMRGDINRRFEESRRRLDDMKADVDRRFEETSCRFDEWIQETRRRFDAISQQIDSRIAQVDKRIGRLFAVLTAVLVGTGVMISAAQFLAAIFYRAVRRPWYPCCSKKMPGPGLSFHRPQGTFADRTRPGRPHIRLEILRTDLRRPAPNRPASVPSRPAF